MRRWQTIRSNYAPRHMHHAAYVSVVMSGGYEEAGDFGRFFLEPGDVLFHEKFESHLNRFMPGGVTVLNLPLHELDLSREGLFQVGDLDRIVRLSERDPRDAAECLHCVTTRKVQRLWDWPDELAATIRDNPGLRLSEWAIANGLRGWALTRGFQKVFGVAPETFRAHVRTTLALRRVRGTAESFTDISASAGFSDQSHMCRSIRGLTGQSPGAWRKKHSKSRTD